MILYPLSPEPDGITLDIDNRLIYWTDNGTNTIEKANLDGGGKQPILTLDLNKPRAVVVDSTSG